MFMKCQMSVPERPENGTYMSNNEGSDKRMVVVERVRVESCSLMVATVGKENENVCSCLGDGGSGLGDG